MASRIIRITMFKIPSKGDVAKALEFYDTLSKTAVKVPPSYTNISHPSSKSST
jgi:hypothetical protein